MSLFVSTKQRSNAIEIMDDFSISGSVLRDTLDKIDNINTFLGGNLGVGFDFGFTYHLSKQLEITGSIIDLGFINYSKKNKVYTAKGNFTLEGINFLFDPSSSVDYFTQLEEDFEENVKREENEDSYIAWRPTKINSSIKYSFGEKRSRFCYDLRNNEYFSNAIGLQLFSVFRPLSPQIGLTGF